MGIGCEFSSLMDSLGYLFIDNTYLQTALTHTSYTNEMRSRGFRAESNESLEFLGDAVLEIVISELLFDRHRKHGEGALTRYRQNLVCERTLYEIALKLDLGKYLNIGTGEEALGLRARPKVLADALEAVIAAVYIDDRENAHGARYYGVIVNLFNDMIDRVVKNSSTDYKTRLQQFIEKNGDSILSYKYEETGPDHNKCFTATAYVNNNKVGVGSGATKRAAEMEAARAALLLFGII